MCELRILHAEPQRLYKMIFTKESTRNYHIDICYVVVRFFFGGLSGWMISDKSLHFDGAD